MGAKGNRGGKVWGKRAVSWEGRERWPEVKVTYHDGRAEIQRQAIQRDGKLVAFGQLGALLARGDGDGLEVGCVPGWHAFEVEDLLRWDLWSVYAHVWLTEGEEGGL
jgi:hypothetical protein